MFGKSINQTAKIVSFIDQFVGV